MASHFLDSQLVAQVATELHSRYPLVPALESLGKFLQGRRLPEGEPVVGGINLGGVLGTRGARNLQRHRLPDAGRYRL